MESFPPHNTRHEVKHDRIRGAASVAARHALSTALPPPHLHRRPIAIDDVEMADLSLGTTRQSARSSPILSAHGRKKQNQMFVAMMFATPPFPFLSFAALQGLFDWLFLWWTNGETCAFTR